MARKLTFTITESEAEIKKLIKTSPAHLAQRLEMLLAYKKSKLYVNQIELAIKIGAGHNSVQKWRTIYIDAGIKGLLEHGERMDFARSVISIEVHKKIEKKLSLKKIHSKALQSCMNGSILTW